MLRGGYKTLTNWFSHAPRVPGTLELIVGWVALASFVAFGLCLWDKRQTRRMKTRIPERSLLLWALFGGSPGLILGMLVARHKTRKATFLIPLAFVVILQAGVAWYTLR